MAAISSAVDESGDPVKPERIAKPKSAYVLMSLRPDGRAISFFGDLHPSFSGNVVVPAGSAKKNHSVVSCAYSPGVQSPSHRPRRFPAAAR